MLTLTASALASIAAPVAARWRCPPIAAGRLASPLCMTQPYVNGHAAPSVSSGDILTTITPIDAPLPAEQIDLDATGAMDAVSATPAEPAAEELEDPSQPPISMFDVDAATVALLAEQGIT